MAVRQVLISVCDFCYQERDTTKARLGVGPGNSMRTLDLCDECIAPVRDILAKAPRRRRSVTLSNIPRISEAELNSPGGTLSKGGRGKGRNGTTSSQGNNQKKAGVGDANTTT